MNKVSLDADIEFRDFHFGSLTGICIGLGGTHIHIIVPGKGVYQIDEDDIISVKPFISAS
jgi:hypothetical protein